MQFFIKLVISTFIIALVSEIARRFTLVAAIIASLPLTSILALVWLYYETGSVQKIIDLSSSIFWAVLPSLVFFVVFPLFLKTGFKFAPALFLSALIMAVGYALYVFLLGKFGIKI